MLPLKLSKTAKFLADPDAIKSSFIWRPFSFAAYELVKGLKAHRCSPLTVVDIGANEGQFTRAILQTFPAAKIFAFEPLLAAAREFERHFRANDRVRFHRQACGDLAGEAEININTFSQSSSILRLAEYHRSKFPSANEIGKAAVEVVRLDDAIRDYDFNIPALLKIDVQGYELHVLRGAKETLSRTQYVLVETCFVPMYEEEPAFEEIMKVLNDSGFRFMGPLSVLWDETKGIALQMDALFGRSM